MSWPFSELKIRMDLSFEQVIYLVPFSANMSLLTALVWPVSNSSWSLISRIDILRFWVTTESCEIS